MSGDKTPAAAPPTNRPQGSGARRRKMPSAPTTPASGPAATPEVSDQMPEEPSVPTETKSPPVRLDVLFPAYSAPTYDEQARARREQRIEELRAAYLGEGLALYVGAGVSMSIGLPSWNELIHSLTVAMMSRRVTSAAQALESLTEEQRAEALNALLEEVKQQKYSQKPTLMMARALKDQFGDELPRQVAAHLYGRLKLGSGLLGRLFSFIFLKSRQTASVDELELPTSVLLDALVALIRPQRNVAGVQALINYNYDDILEERLRKESVPCITMLSGRQKVTRGKIPSYHVHGALPIRQYVNAPERNRKIDNGNFVFSEDEYHSEYADPYRWSNLTQIGLLGRHKGLFVGLSMQDPNLRRLIDVTHRQYPEIWNYAILPRAARAANEDSKNTILRNLAEFVEEDSFLKIGVKVIWVDDIKQDIAPILERIARLPDE
jgi:hypothetical protein